MPWINLGTYTLNDEWQMTSPIEGEIFRVTSQEIPNLGNTYVKGVIAQAFDEGGINIFNPKILSYRSELEIFPFYFPVGIALQSLAFKRLDSDPNPWIIQAEVFQSNNSSEDLNNYLVGRFGDVLPLLQSINTITTPTMTTPSLDLSPNYRSVNNIGGSLQCGLLIPANPNREYILIRTAKDPLFLFTDEFIVDGQGQPDYFQPITFLQELSQRQESSFIRSPRGIYKGAIYARQARLEPITYTEYSAIVPNP